MKKKSDKNARGDASGLRSLAAPGRRHQVAFKDMPCATKDEYVAFHKAACERMHEITLAKNSDYTGDNADPYFNFTRVEELGFASTEQGFLTRLTDKLCRIGSLTKKEAKVKDESIEDTLLDLANYAILFIGHLRSKRMRKVEA